ncbi:MAG: DUF1294 domain-containing protein [Clostridiales bacterium]|nr:DUF1294 domain-containing protein [Clostridiales bacterium]
MPYIAIAYLTLLSAIAIVITVHDKRAARQHNARRVPERSLLTISLLGGALAMLITMCLVRHKTKHAKFMVGLPLIILLQLGVTFLLWWFL